MTPRRHDAGRAASRSSRYLARLVWPTLTLGFMLALVQRGRASWSRLVELQRHQARHPRRHRRRRCRRRRRPRASRSRTSPSRSASARCSRTSASSSTPGTVTAIVGRTGAGKSTLVDALCRLIEVPAGTIFIDGRDVTTLPLASLRAQIGYAPQEAFLFSTTIADNIAMGYGGGTAIPAARARRSSSASVGDGGRRGPARRAEGDRGGRRRPGSTRDLAAMPEGLGDDRRRARHHAVGRPAPARRARPRARRRRRGCSCSTTRCRRSTPRPSG